MFDFCSLLSPSNYFFGKRWPLHNDSQGPVRVSNATFRRTVLGQRLILHRDENKGAKTGYETATPAEDVPSRPRLVKCVPVPCYLIEILPKSEVRVTAVQLHDAGRRRTSNKMHIATLFVAFSIVALVTLTKDGFCFDSLSIPTVHFRSHGMDLCPISKTRNAHVRFRMIDRGDFRDAYDDLIPRKSASDLSSDPPASTLMRHECEYAWNLVINAHSEVCKSQDWIRRRKRRRYRGIPLIKSRI